MPHSNTARKRVRQNEKTRLRNKSVKSSMRTQVKKTLEAIAEGDAERAKKEFALASQKLDKAAKSNVIHKNQAARRKSRLQRAVNQLTAK